VSQHIVVVDDAATNLEIMSAIASDIPDSVVHPFSDSREAMAWAFEHHVDAFIVDYNMPDPDGLAMIRMLRADSRYRLVPIVVITAAQEFDVRLAALAAGANDFLERPIERREVLSRVQTLLALQAARFVLAAQVDDLEDNLLREERKSRAQAERLETLWRVANASHDPRSESAVQAVLSEGAAAIRSGQAFFGSIVRLDGDDAIFFAAASTEQPSHIVMNYAPLGSRIPLAEIPQHYAVDAGTTRSWDDLSADPDVASLPIVMALGERALICTPFRVGSTTYVLSFGSGQPAHDPFGPEDHTYVQLLADFFSSRLQQVAQSDRLIYHLTHDTLTGLRNRTQFRLDARIQLASTGCGTVATVAIDAFRGINDEFGHIIGDALLVEVGAGLAQIADAENDVVGRLAGDTFGIYLGGVCTEAELRIRLEAISQLFTRPFSTGDREGKEFVPLTATIGAACTPDGTMSIDQLLARADTAVFAAKQRGPGHVEVYQPAMESESRSRARRLAEISAGLENGEFELFFQPHLDLLSETVSGAEALLRWRHPEHGMLSPASFLPFAEQNGMIRSITRWVMNSSLDAAERLRERDAAFRLYFNLSAIDFADEAIVSDLRLAADRGVHLQNVGIELTETAAMHDVGTAARTLRQLQDLGVCVALDDFGTGYSSLSMLKRLPFDIIKIDRSFISEVTTGEHDSAIAASILAIGEQLGYETLAEGIETAEQLAWFKARGCRYAQGYMIAEPMPLESFERWLADRSKDAA
jgi:diguanylate cyclase (GGDEF)-like protein